MEVADQVKVVNMVSQHKLTVVKQALRENFFLESIQVSITFLIYDACEMISTVSIIIRTKPLSRESNHSRQRGVS